MVFIDEKNQQRFFLSGHRKVFLPLIVEIPYCDNFFMIEKIVADFLLEVLVINRDADSMCDNQRFVSVLPSVPNDGCVAVTALN